MEIWESTVMGTEGIDMGIVVRLTVRGSLDSSASSTRKRPYLIRLLMWLCSLGLTLSTWEQVQQSKMRICVPLILDLSFSVKSCS